MDNERGKELRDDIKQEMWETALNFLKGVDCESIADMCWNYNDDGAITKLEIIFEYPMYLTEPPKSRERRQ